MSRHDLRVTLSQMRDYAVNAVAMLEGRTAADLSGFEFRMALERVFTVLGEAAGRLDQIFRESHPQVPWQQMIGMRNVIVHGYDVVSPVLLWQTAAQDLPELVQALDAALVEFGGPIVPG